MQREVQADIDERADEGRTEQMVALIRKAMVRLPAELKIAVQHLSCIANTCESSANTCESSAL
jgi:hypothetical protein